MSAIIDDDLVEAALRAACRAGCRLVTPGCICVGECAVEEFPLDQFEEMRAALAVAVPAIGERCAAAIDDLDWQTAETFTAHEIAAATIRSLTKEGSK